MLKVELTGNLGRDAEVKNVNGDTIMSFSIGSNKRVKNPDGSHKDITTWVNCSKWHKGDFKPAVAQYLTKGCKVFVRGDLRVRSYQGKQGDTQFSIECMVDEIELLGGGTAAGASQTTAQGSNEPPADFFADSNTGNPSF